jgi:hypothetical protein
MAISVKCPSCGLEGLFPDDWSGSAIECARCHASVFLAGPAGAQSPPGTLAGPPPSPPGQMFVLTSEVGPTPTATPRQSGIDTFIPLHTQSPSPPPSLTLEPPEDEPGEKQWIGEEAQRFKAYIGQQLSALRQQRHDLTALHAQLEAKSITREQELNRQQSVLAAKTDLLRQREEVIARQEMALARGREELAELEQTLRDFQEQRNLAEQEIVDLRRRGNALRAEVEQLQHSANAVREGMKALEEQRRAFKAEQDAWAERLALWERRQSTLDRDEQSLQRRTAEVEELEERVRAELEERARALDRRQKLLDQQEQRLAPPPWSPPQPGVPHERP